MRPATRSTTRRLRAMTVAAVAGALTLTGCSVYDAPLPGGPSTGDDPITVTARFRDVLDLVPQSTVKVDDINVGKVTAIDLDGYVAEVTLELDSANPIPEDAFAQIRQTSLLGEKFVALQAPTDGSGQQLADGDVIGLDRTGRNPELEEVLGALALLLNGGGVGQLKSITQELNNALDGRTADIKSVLTQIDTFIGELDDNSDAIITAIENTNRLAQRARDQQATIEAALDDVPAALRSLDGQREDLVTLLESLTRLSDVGTRVIRQSKDDTIKVLEDLGPVLEQLADAGQALPDSFQVFLTYPFIDEAVGRDPQVARNLHMGDYTNLSIDLDIDLLNLQLPGLPEAVCEGLDQVLDGVEAGVDELFATTEVQDQLGGLDEALNELTGRDVLQLEQFTADVRERVLARALRLAREQCRAPDTSELRGFLDSALTRLLAQEGLPLNLAEIRRLVDDLLGGLLGDGPGLLGGGSLLGGLLSGGNGGGGNGGGGNGGGGLGGLLGGNSRNDNGGNGGNSGGGGGGLIGGIFGRAAPAFDADDRQIDPFGIAARGLDPGIGTLLLQGVARNQ